MSVPSPTPSFRLAFSRTTFYHCRFFLFSAQHSIAERFGCISFTFILIDFAFTVGSEVCCPRFPTNTVTSITGGSESRGLLEGKIGDIEVCTESKFHFNDIHGVAGEARGVHQRFAAGF